MTVLIDKRILVIEDEYLIAVQLCDILARAGARVIGPVPTVSEALQTIQSVEIDAALLNHNLLDGVSIPVAGELQKRTIPYVYVTAHERLQLPGTHVQVPIVQKPVSSVALVRAVEAVIAAPPGLATEG